MRARGLPFCLTVAILFSSVSVLAQVTAVKGKVLAEGGLPIPTAKVLCFDGPTKLTLVPVPVKLDGSFTFPLPLFNGTHLTCECSAPDFVSTRLTLIVREGVAEAGDISLKKKKTLQADPLSLTYSADGLNTFLDAFLLNDSTAAIEVRKVEVKGTALSVTSCLDLRPTVIFTVTASLPLGKSGEVPVNVESPMEEWNDSVLAKGQLEALPCKQERLFLGIDYSFNLQPGEKRKVRIAIPRKLAAAAGQAARADLKEWAFLSVKFFLSEGEPVESDVAN